MDGTRRRKPRPPRRVTRPCDACRRRKTRCISEEEGAATCVSCNERGVECTFERDPPGRQRPTGTSHDANGTTPNRSRNLPADAQATIASFSPLAVASDGVQATSSDFSSHVRNAGSAHSPVSIRTSVHIQNHHESNHAETQSLGQSNHRFAELYGITSDMEPILMVCPTSVCHEKCPYSLSSSGIGLMMNSAMSIVLRHIESGVCYKVTKGRTIPSLSTPSRTRNQLDIQQATPRLTPSKPV